MGGLAAPVHKMTQQRPCPTTWLPRTTWRETRRTHHLLKRTSNWSSREMNRVFNCPNLYSAAGPFTTVVQMVPVMVANHQTGGYFVVHLPVQPLPEHVAQPQHVFHPQPSDSPFSSSSTSSSTCSSTSPPASDDGFVDGSDLESETGSLVEMVDDIKLDFSLDSSMELTDEESDYEILDEDL